MLGAPGVYFLYFLSYLRCVGRMVSGFCTILLVRVPQYSSSCWSATTKTSASCPGGNLNLERIIQVNLLGECLARSH
jgi:hypothetical protein